MTRKRPSTRSGDCRRTRTVSISLRDRGQTTQDFAVGIGVFILAVAFVFSFLPTILTPFDSTVSGGETAQADRIADRTVHNLSTSSGPPNEIDGDQFKSHYVSDPDGNLSDWLGLRKDGTRYDRVNIRLERLNGTAVQNMDAEWSAGDEYRNQSAASSARIVRVVNGPPSCDLGCRLVVRTW